MSHYVRHDEATRRVYDDSACEETTGITPSSGEIQTSDSLSLLTSLYLVVSSPSLPPSLSLPLLSLSAAAQTATAPPVSPSPSVSVALSVYLSPPASPFPSIHALPCSPLSVRTCSRGSGDEAPKCLLPDGLVVRAVRAGLPVLVHRLQQLQR